MLSPGGLGRQWQRGYSRPRRVSRARVVVASVIAVLVAGTSWLAWSSSTERREAPKPAATPSCPTPSPPPTVVPEKQITVNVYNATDRQGLATAVAGQLAKRGFRIGKVDNDPLGRSVTGTAEVRHGPQGADAARTVTAQVDDAVAVPDQRGGLRVDLVLGAGFVRLQAREQAAAALLLSSAPTPAGC